MGCSPSKPKVSDEKKEPQPLKNDIQVTDMDSTVLAIKNGKDRVRKLVKQNQGDVAVYQKLAKEAMERKNPELAKTYLRMKKLKEDKMGDHYNMILRYEDQLGTLQSAQDQSELTKLTMEVNRTVEQAQKDMGSIEELEKLLEKTDDLAANVTEFNATLENTFGDMSADDEDLLNELQNKINQEEALSAEPLPSVPQAEVQEAPKVSMVQEETPLEIEKGEEEKGEEEKGEEEEEEEHGEREAVLEL